MKKIALMLMILSVISAQGWDVARVESVQKQYPQYKGQIQGVVGQLVNFARQSSALQAKYTGKIMPEDDRKYLNNLLEAVADKERELTQLLDKIELEVDWMLVSTVGRDRWKDALVKYPQYKQQIEKIVGERNNYANALVYEQKKFIGKTPSSYDVTQINLIQSNIDAKERELNALLDRLEISGR